MRTNMRAPLTLTLLVAIAVTYLVQIGASVRYYTEVSSARMDEALIATLLTDQSRQWEGLGALTPGTLERHEYWRLVAAPFLHIGLAHLLLNAWALLQLGVLFETSFGSIRLLLVWVISSLAASATSVMFLEKSISVGASGAILGIAGATLVLMRNRRWQRRMRWRILFWASLTIVLGFTSPHIDNAAHVGGFMAGLAVGSLLRYGTVLPPATASATPR
jgi:membrane associated rhomboid family serine protease